LKIWIPADPDQFAANKDKALWGFVMDVPAEARGIVAAPQNQPELLATPTLVAVNGDQAEIASRLFGLAAQACMGNGCDISFLSRLITAAWTPESPLLAFSRGPLVVHGFCGIDLHMALAFRQGKLKADQSLSSFLKTLPTPWQLYAEINAPFIAAAELCRLAGRQKARKGHQTNEEARHSADFRSVNWFGQEYTFTANQAACIRLLWEAWESGAPEVGGDTLLVEAESDQRRLSVTFRGHPAWGTMIRPGQTKGSYRLSPPDAHRKAPEKRR